MLEKVIILGESLERDDDSSEDQVNIKKEDEATVGIQGRFTYVKCTHYPHMFNHIGFNMLKVCK